MGSGAGSIRVGPCRFRGARRRGFRAVSLVAAVGLVAAGLGAPATAVGDTTRRVSVSSTGAQGNDQSRDPAISSDGRYVAFSSDASNLVPGDTNATRDVFVRDRKLGTTRRVSVSSNETQGNSVSFGLPVITSDGRYVAFGSDASNLVPGDTNGSADVFVRDRKLGTTRRVSVSSSETQGNGLQLRAAGDQFGMAGTSPSARSRRTWCPATPTTPPTCSSGTGSWAPPAGSACPAPEPRATAAVSSRRSVRAAGTSPSVRLRRTWCPVTPTTPSTCSSGTGAGHHPPGQRVQHRSPGRRVSFGPAISSAGRYVAFSSDASNLVPGDTNAAQDVFVRDRQLGTTRRVSVSSTGAQGNSDSFDPAISSAGRYVAFSSDASNLVPGDTERHRDVFVRDRSWAPPAGSACPAPEPRATDQLRAGDQFGRPVRRLHLGRVEPGARRHQRRLRRVRPNPWRNSVAANATIDLVESPEDDNGSRPACAGQEPVSVCAPGLPRCARQQALARRE